MKILQWYWQCETISRWRLIFPWKSPISSRSPILRIRSPNSKWRNSRNRRRPWLNRNVVLLKLGLGGTNVVTRKRESSSANESWNVASPLDGPFLKWNISSLHSPFATRVALPSFAASFAFDSAGLKINWQPTRVFQPVPSMRRITPRVGMHRDRESRVRCFQVSVVLDRGPFRSRSFSAENLGCGNFFSSLSYIYIHKKSPHMSVCLSGTLPIHWTAPMYWIKPKPQTSWKLDSRVNGGGESESDIRNW